MRFHVIQDDETTVVELDEPRDGTIRAKVDGRPIEADLRTIDGALLLVAGGRTLELVASGTPPRMSLWTRDREVAVRVLDGRQARAQSSRAGRSVEEDKNIRSPMPGRVVKVMAAPGDQVERGQGVIVVEAMKMENELSAPAAGRVRTVHTEAGKTVESGQVLVEIE